MNKSVLFGVSVGLVLLGGVIACNRMAGSGALARPEGPCDVYARGGTPCVAAHSTTRALYASYNGPLYQIMRQSDGRRLDIGVVKASAGDPGGYADAAAQDAFCKDTYCWVTILYDQSGTGNHLYQAPRGGFSGPAMGGYNNVPLADWAPVTVMGHKVYGLFIAPGMGMRIDDPIGTAVDDQAEGQYWVFSGQHYNSGCCFDYGNAETDSRDDGDGTMETTYFGNSRGWYYGEGDGPWIMTDQENNLVGCVNPDPNDKYCRGLNSVDWRFVTAMADGEPHHWRSMGGDAQQGELKIYYDGGRIQNPRSSYDPMRKQGAILLGNGGDNSNGSAGTFYEGAMTAAGTFPTEAVNQEIQANVVAAGYKVATVEVFPSLEGNRPSNVQTYEPGQTRKAVVRFVNTTEAPVEGLVLSLKTPKGWKAAAEGNPQMRVPYAVAPGQTVVAEFDVTAGSSALSGDLVALAAWKDAGGTVRQSGRLKVRSVPAVKINEFSISDGFIELYNASDRSVDLSGWTVRHHATHIPAFSEIRIPSGTQLAPKAYYLLGMAQTGLAAGAAKGDDVIYVRSVDGIKAGDEIVVDGEKRTVKSVTAPQPPQPVAPGTRRPAGGPGVPTTVWQPLPGGHGIEIPAGSTNVPVTSTYGFQVGQKMLLGYGAERPAVSQNLEKYEVVTVTAVGKPGTQAWLSMDAKPGDTNIKVSSTENISVGDKIRLDIDSKGHGIETVTVTKVGTPSVRNTFGGPLGPDEDPGTGLDIAEPLKFAHASNMPFSNNGTGITFEPATKYPHYSNEPVLALCYEIALDSPLASAHPIDAAVTGGSGAAAGAYAGAVPADLVYGGPALSEAGGSILLRDARGNVADALNFGLLVDPWLSEGYQADSGANEPGNFVQTPSGGRRGGFIAGPAMLPASTSAGRFPDGADLDDNKNDFRAQRTFVLGAPVAAGEDNIKLLSVQGIAPNASIVIGRGADAQLVQVKEVGSAGATALAAPAGPGARTLVVTSAQSFTAGQAVLVGGERAEVAEVIIPRGRRLSPAEMQQKLVLKTPLRKSHKAAEPVCGTGVTLAAPLKAAFAAGAPVATGRPTPGAANQY
ncbi:MAG: lamin tail domain-containing protein [Bacteroidales bacterium]|nr:lamin tail domain-containing protein [Bacteroidales bacterium]